MITSKTARSPLSHPKERRGRGYRISKKQLHSSEVPVKASGNPEGTPKIQGTLGCLQAHVSICPLMPCLDRCHRQRVEAMQASTLSSRGFLPCSLFLLVPEDIRRLHLLLSAPQAKLLQPGCPLSDRLRALWKTK